MDLVRKVVKRIRGVYMSCKVYASDGGCCSDNWDGDSEIELSDEEMRYLVRQRLGWEEPFEGLELTEIDLDEKLAEISKSEDEWSKEDVDFVGDGTVPSELDGLYDDVEGVDVNDPQELHAVRERLKAVEGGLYTFYFTIERDCLCLQECEAFQLKLTAEQALGLLRGECSNKEVFDGICENELDSDFVNDLAKKQNLADSVDLDEINPYCYWGRCDALDVMLDSWVYLINRVREGKIPEEELDSWLEYFEDFPGEDTPIEKWKK